MLDIKLRQILINDYKGINYLDINFPMPDRSGDPDVIVLGSENGLGKTAVLECCALSLFLLKVLDTRETSQTDSDHFNLIVRAGKPQAMITGTLSNGTEIGVRIRNHAVYGAIRSSQTNDSAEKKVIVFRRDGLTGLRTKSKDTIRKILGHDPNPVIEQNFLFFHEYRKNLEGNPRARTLFGDTVRDTAISTFKRTALLLKMHTAGLFETSNDQNSQELLDKLDDLLKLYAACRFAKLQQTESGGLELRVQPIDGGDAFNFDGLSSGQKEIITTLFLIWYETRNTSKVVLIDEPELHLNSQWHRDFIHSLNKLAPQNQYIIATHSATIMDSVSRDRRILLQQDEEVFQ